MTAAWKSFCMSLGDPLLSWLLLLPRDLALLVLTMGTALLMVGLRAVATNQTWLRSVLADERRLHQLINRAAPPIDEAARARYRRTRTMLAWQRLNTELKSALVATLPTAVLVTWMAMRLPYLPIRDHDELPFTLVAPVSMIGTIVHLVPQDPIQVKDGWVKVVQPARLDDQSRGMAVWFVQFKGNGAATSLTVRTEPHESERNDPARGAGMAPQDIQHLVSARYSGSRPPHQFHGNQWETRLELRAYRPFGVVAALPDWILPGWLLVYLPLVVVFFVLLKRVCRIA